MSSNSIVSSLFWKFLERGGTQITQFIVSIIIARLLLPNDYGAVALLMIFISIASVFVQSGLNTALIQKKDADEMDFSSVFIYSIGLASIIYLCLFFAAEWIELFYKIKGLALLFRVLALTLFPGALNAIQVAAMSKEMQFKKQFHSSIIACFLSGLLGIFMAYNGYGAWALVAQQISSQIIGCIVLWILVDWRPHLLFSFQRTKCLLIYGTKLLGANLIDTIYHNMESLIIGKMFTPATLAYCNKGKMFPLTLINNIDGSIQSVMLPAYSAQQDDNLALKNLLRKTISLSTYLVFPAMTLLAAMGTPVIYLFLGNNWLECVPYLQLFCFIAMVLPLQTANLQAINALGRSEIYLKLMAYKRFIGFILLVASIFIYRSPFSVVVAALLIEIISVGINIPFNKKILNYSFGEMMMDILPNFINSIIIGCVCFSMVYICDNYILLLFAQLLIGLSLYILLSFMTSNCSFVYVQSMIKSKIKKES